MLSEEDQATLVSLMNSRAEITDSATWATLYRLVNGELAGFFPWELRSSSESKKDLVDFFFSYKIYESRLSHVRPITRSSELRTWFVRFLVSQWRHTESLREMPLLNGDAQESDPIVDKFPTMEGCHHLAEHHANAVLQELGVKPDYLADSAKALCMDLPPAWLSVIQHHTCEDEPRRLPMSKIAKLMRIQSYHYQARKIGLVGCHGGHFNGFEHTTLGKWLATAGIPPIPENARAMAVAFEFLCEAALAMPVDLAMETQQ